MKLLLRRSALAITALLLSACQTSSTTPGGEVIRVTVIPLESPTEMMRKYQPMSAYLQTKLGRPVEFVPVTDYGAAVQALAAKKVDFAWLGGFTYVQAKRLAGAKPICQRDIDQKFKTVFICSTASKIKQLSDLKGKRFAFG